MWEYKVVAGAYTVDGANVHVKNPAGEGTLQQILDHYGKDDWELVGSSLDSLNREVVLCFKRPKGGAASYSPPAAAAAAAAPPPAPAPSPAPAPAAAGPKFVDPDGEVVRRRTPQQPSSAPPPRRSKRDLDSLARDD